MKILMILLYLCCSLLQAIAVISVSPDTTFAELDQTITVDIMVNQVEDLYAVAFDLVYNPSFVEFDSIEEGNFLNENGTASTSFIYDYSQYGRIIIALTRLGNVSGVATIEDTTIVSVLFTTLNYGWTDMTFENVGLMDSNLEPIEFTIEFGSINIMGPPEIIPLPDTTFIQGETIIINLNNYVTDPDTQIELLNWEIVEAGFLNTEIDSLNNLYLSSENNTGVVDVIIEVSDGYYTDSDTFNVEVTEETGANNNELPKQNNMLNVIIYPNPIRNFTNFMIKNSNSEAVFKLYNIKGQLIEKGNIGFAENRNIVFHYNTSKLSCGYYILTIENENNKINKKILKIN